MLVYNLLPRSWLCEHGTETKNLLCANGYGQVTAGHRHGLEEFGQILRPLPNNRWTYHILSNVYPPYRTFSGWCLVETLKTKMDQNLAIIIGQVYRSSHSWGVVVSHTDTSV